jgi:hypothetical protein
VHAFTPLWGILAGIFPWWNGWNRSIWPMQSIGKMPVNIVAMSILQNRVMAPPCASVVIGLETGRRWGGAAVGGEGARAVPETVVSGRGKPPTPISAVA